MRGSKFAKSSTTKKKTVEGKGIIVDDIAMKVNSCLFFDWVKAWQLLQPLARHFNKFKSLIFGRFLSLKNLLV